MYSEYTQNISLAPIRGWIWLSSHWVAQPLPCLKLGGKKTWKSCCKGCSDLWPGWDSQTSQFRGGRLQTLGICFLFLIILYLVCVYMCMCGHFLYWWARWCKLDEEFLSYTHNLQKLESIHQYLGSDHGPIINTKPLAENALFFLALQDVYYIYGFFKA